MATKKELHSLGYNVLHKIGQGAFGEVKLAQSEKHPDKVAIKIINNKCIPRYAYQQCLFYEVPILKYSKHPHIVHVHDIHIRASGQIFIVMEAAAMDLAEKIRQLRRIPPDQARLWFSQLISAMVYLHNKNIAHRDLKCGNILLTADNQVRLTDFGLGCYTLGFPVLRGTCCGTPLYSAPEVLKKEPYDAKKSDVWSMGVILYNMLTGSLPFLAITCKGLRRVQLKPLKYPRKINVDEPCRDLISSMMSYFPFCRPEVAALEQHPWLQPKEEQKETDDETAAADTPPTVAETPPEEKEPETPEGQTTEKTDDQQTQRQEQRDVPKDDLEQKTSRVSTNEFPATAVSKEEEDKQEEERGINGSQRIEKDSQSLAASIRNGETVEDSSAPGCCAFLTAVKRAVKARVVAQIVRGSCALQKKIKKMFRKKKHPNPSNVTITIYG
ncbi:testis-specific serine/threonine-protein kinase 6-like [Astyanax mexicanus]|uniref:Testis specific serine kinase 6 n=1 Tax=Astyanax mexicanus TaxID=7994 RepID=A0A8B9HJZ3_ASTMX|nr:testis-specific serine/threonine-protein kinase 6-like [Astyanax mexicanus]